MHAIYKWLMPPKAFMYHTGDASKSRDKQTTCAICWGDITGLYVYHDKGEAHPIDKSCAEKWQKELLSNNKKLTCCFCCRPVNSLFSKPKNNHPWEKRVVNEIKAMSNDVCWGLIAGGVGATVAAMVERITNMMLTDSIGAGLLGAIIGLGAVGLTEMSAQRSRVPIKFEIIEVGGTAGVVVATLALIVESVAEGILVKPSITVETAGALTGALVALVVGNIMRRRF